MQNKRQVLAILVDNEFGVLSQITRLFTRKGFNIETIAAGPTTDPEITRITIEIFDTDEHLILLVNQLRKLFPVHSVKILDPQHSIRRELMLIKVAVSSSEERAEIIQIANIFRASVIDVSINSITLSVIGGDDKLSAIQSMLEAHTIMELARTGAVALERGTFTIDEETKEKGEFNYSKNVL